MGCDIHCVCEVRENGIWKKVDEPVFKNYYYYGLWNLDNKLNYAEYIDKPIVEREYSLFSILAGVRNYNRITPIDYPRGLPYDISKESQKYFDIFEDAEDFPVLHSHSFLTLEEIKEYDWDIPIMAWVDEQTLNEVEVKAKDLWFYVTNLPKLEGLIPKDGSAADVRIVFAFDN